MKDLKLESVIEDLLKSAKKQGTITEQEIGASLIDFDITSDEMKDIVSKFTAEGIVVENDEEIMKDDDLKDIISNIRVDDPVKMYLKDIGSVELLTSEQEIELAEFLKAIKEQNTNLVKET